jgi:hypothetical protein
MKSSERQMKSYPNASCASGPCLYSEREASFFSGKGGNRDIIIFTLCWSWGVSLVALLWMDGLLTVEWT